MNKKNMAKLGVSLGLVGALGVGATLAMLSASTSELKNEFALSTKGIGITLDEKKFNEDGRTTTGNNYGTLVSGQTVTKDPTVHISAESLNTNVFVKVVNPNGTNLDYNKDNIGSIWKEVRVTDAGANNTSDSIKYYVYMGPKATGAKDNNEEYKDTYGVVPTSDKITDLEAVFNTMTVNDFDSTTEMSGVVLQDVLVRAAAVQADSVSDDAALAKAVELLNSTQN